MNSLEINSEELVPFQRDLYCGKVFLGVTQDKDIHLTEIVKSAFQENPRRFNLCKISGLDNFSYASFSAWATELHCEKNVSDETWVKLKLYVINYMICPKVQDELEVLAMYDYIWGNAQEEQQSTSASLDLSAPKPWKSFIGGLITAYMSLILYQWVLQL